MPERRFNKYNATSKGYENFGWWGLQGDPENADQGEAAELASGQHRDVPLLSEGWSAGLGA